VEDLITQAEFARAVGVSRMSITKAIQSGRLRVFNGRGDQVAPGYSGKRWLKPDVAAKDWENRRLRLDDNMDGASDLLAARTRTAVAHAELEEMRVARERGMWMPKALFQEAIGDVLRAVKQAHLNAVYGVEEICGAYQSNGLPAAAGRMRAQMVELLNSIADMLAAAEAKFEPPEGDGDGG
jgi:hypothetical protein